MSMSLPTYSGYGNTFVDERKEEESPKFWEVVSQKLTTFFRAINQLTVNWFFYFYEKSILKKVYF